MKKCQVDLRPTDRDYLENLLRKGQLGVRQFKRATGLLELNRGKLSRHYDTMRPDPVGVNPSDT